MQLLSVVIAAPSEDDAHFVRGRVYPKVGGYIGRFDNIALASFAAPSARDGLYHGATPLPPQALGTSEQILIGTPPRSTSGSRNWRASSTPRRPWT